MERLWFLLVLFLFSFLKSTNGNNNLTQTSKTHTCPSGWVIGDNCGKEWCYKIVPVPASWVTTSSLMLLFMKDYCFSKYIVLKIITVNFIIQKLYQLQFIAQKKIIFLVNLKKKNTVTQNTLVTII